MSVECDAAWARNIVDVSERDHPDSPVHIHHADIGATTHRGRPKNARIFRMFHKYPLEIWGQEYFQHPDLFFTDRRFRIGCYITTLFRTTRPVKLLFDDYSPRPEYSVIERYAKPTQLVGRMSVFDLNPMSFPIERMTEIFGWYARRSRK